MNFAKDYYRQQITGSEEGISIGLSYFRERGFNDRTIEKFELGYALEGWENFSNEAIAKGYNKELLEKTGLIVKKEDGSTYDRFRGRVIFPVHNISGKVIAFGARMLGKDKNQPKYINSPETPLYDKSSILFGYDRAKQMMRQQNFTILVEGQMDLIMAHQAGALNTVAVSGTALTEKHLALLKRLSENLVFAFDADDAGLAATARAFGIALGMGMNVRVAQIPEGKDPADYILKNPSGWAEVIANSKHIINFYLGVLRAKESNNGIFRKEVENKMKILNSSFML